ncbi:ABC transporter permease [Aequorivita echinoideorum]|uniref:ABC transporter permease n=1 Tax=Aequorivita echinoideorum TaxID=1549647 RepID=UPI001FE747E8|nr:ABC transporter permease [Aequorivita echinoideorum]
MNLWKITFSNILYKPLYSILSVLSLSISIGLLLGIQQMDASLQDQLKNSYGNIDMVIGAKGSPLQLILSSVLHIDNPTGNISLKQAEEIAKNPLVKLAVPISYGDNYLGFRIVGTNSDFSKFFNAKLGTGRQVAAPLEVILGSEVASQANLKIGDTFLSSHGLAESTEDVHHHPMKVVGIYERTGKVIDRLIVSKLESIWELHHHEKASGHEFHDSDHNDIEQKIEDT